MIFYPVKPVHDITSDESVNSDGSVIVEVKVVIRLELPLPVLSTELWPVVPSVISASEGARDVEVMKLHWAPVDVVDVVVANTVVTVLAS